MSHSNDDTRSSASAAAGKPTLEALLRLKQAERPDEAFWEEFDRGLRQKQLAAIIEPKPWWLGLALVGRKFAHLGLPVSAGAAALLAVVAIRTHSPFARSPGPVEFGPAAGIDRPALVAARVVSAPVASDSPAASGASIAGVAVVDAPAAPEPAEVAAAPVSAPTLAAAASAPAVPVVAALLEIAPPAATAPTPSELAIAHNLAALRSEEPALLASDATRLEIAPEEDTTTAATAGEPALKMEVRNPRHARVLLAMADNPVVETVGGIAHLRDRMVRSLVSDDALGASAGRLGVDGDRFSVSF